MMKTITRAMIQLILCAGFLIPVIVDAATYYVATIGNDGVNCATAQNFVTPKRTISNAIGCLGAGDTVYIRAGTYGEGVSIYNKVGTASQPITIAGYPGDARPLIQPPASWKDAAISINAPVNVDAYVTVKDLGIDAINGNIDAATCVSVWLAHVTVENIYCVNAHRNGIQAYADFITLRNNHIKDCGRVQPAAENDTKGLGIYAGGNPGYYSGSNNLIERNFVEGCRGGGIIVQVGNPSNNIVRYNYLTRFGLYSTWPPPPDRPRFQQTGTGFNLGYPGSGNQFYGNVVSRVRAAARDATCMLFWNGPSNSIFDNNTCYDTDIGAQISSGNSISIRNNIFANVTTVLLESGTGHTISGNLFNPDVSATFVDAPNGDFRLQSGSGAIGLGATIPFPTDDRPSQRPSAPINLRVAQ